MDNFNDPLYWCELLQQYQNNVGYLVTPEHLKSRITRYHTMGDAIHDIGFPHWAYNYAKLIIKDRWLEVEPYIMVSPFTAYWYASNLIKGRWPEAEPFIITDEYWWIAYCKEFNIERVK